MTNDELALRAQEARMILDHPLFKESFAHAKAATVEAIEDMDMTDDVLRDKLMLTLQVLKSIEAHLHSHIETGQIINLRVENF